MGPGVAAIDAARLNQPVRAALQSSAAEVVSWDRSPITGGYGGGTGESSVHRFRGMARDHARELPWTMILKILRKPDSNPPNGDEWKREMDVYRSGLLDKLPEGLAAPRCFGVEEFPGECCWLWLEDITDGVTSWPLTRYRLAARHLGRLSGSHLAPEPLAASPWLSSDWIRNDFADAVAEENRFRDSLDHPLMRRFLPGDAGSKALRLLAEREYFLSALANLPQTLCHFDAFRRNLFARHGQGRDETVLIDWASVGQGPIGADIVALVWVSLCFVEVSSADASMLDRIVYAGFLSGLHDAGWEGDERLVRLGYTAAIALRRIGTYGHMLGSILDETLHERWEAMLHRPITDVADHWARAGRHIERMADEARGLIDVRMR